MMEKVDSCIVVSALWLMGDFDALVGEWGGALKVADPKLSSSLYRILLRTQPPIGLASMLNIRTKGMTIWGLQSEYFAARIRLANHVQRPAN
jgi:hypothetical protein